MTSKTLKSPVIRQVLARGYASVAQQPVDARLSSAVLSNKVTSVAFNNHSPVTRITVAFKAGSRYEQPTELGLTHVLRSAAGLTTKNASSFIIARKLAQIGAQVSASTDREILYYTLEVTQGHTDTAIEYLNNLISCQEFRPWELDDNNPRLKYELSAVPPQVRAADLLHQAAFRRGLGNSLYILPNRVGKISSESLQHFAANYMTTGRCAVAVVGDTLDKASVVGQVLQLNNGSGPETPAKYYGGEQRVDCGGDMAHVALGVQGLPATNEHALALAVAAKALGNGPCVKWGGDCSPLGHALGNIGPFAAAGFNVSYTDSGLFGIILSVPKDEATCAVQCAAKFLKGAQLSESAICAGKAQLKLQILNEAENGASMSENLAAQILTYGCARSPGDLACAIDSITSQEVSSALSAVCKSKLSMGVAGNTQCVPFVEDL